MCSTWNTSPNANHLHESDDGRILEEGGPSESVLSVPTELPSLEVAYFPHGRAKIQKRKLYIGFESRGELGALVPRGTFVA
jgi:hypothetical protein